MTLKELYDKTLIECNKIETATIYLEDFNHYANKAVQEFINRRYASFEVNAQITDDLQVLSRSAQLKLTYIPGTPHSYTAVLTYSDKTETPVVKILNQRKEDGFQFELPSDYQHLLNCIATFFVKGIKPYKGRVPGDYFSFGARRLTSDAEAGITNNAFLKPFFTRPYYLIRDADYTKMGNSPSGNSDTSPKLIIKTGVLEPYFNIDTIDISYLKKPEVLQLTTIQVDALEDTSQYLEFPDDVCAEILKLVTLYILENNSDSRINTFIPINADNTMSALQQQQMAAQQAANNQQ